MYHLTYAALGLVWCALAALVWLQRRDLGRHMLAAGVAGGVLEVVAEYWYLKDYWRPLTILPFPAPEDFVYGFGTTGFTVGIVPLLLNHRFFEPFVAFPRSWRIGYSVAMAVLFCGWMEVAQRYTSLPSIWIATISFALLGFAHYLFLPDTAEPALFTAVIMAVMAFVGYAIGLNLVIDGDNYLHQVYLLWHTTWDNRVAGVPWDEIAWNATRAFCAVGMYMVVADRVLTPRKA